jgi:hypothetical protein
MRRYGFAAPEYEQIRASEGLANLLPGAGAA